MFQTLSAIQETIDHFFTIYQISYAIKLVDIAPINECKICAETYLTTLYLVENSIFEQAD